MLYEVITSNAVAGRNLNRTNITLVEVGLVEKVRRIVHSPNRERVGVKKGQDQR